MDMHFIAASTDMKTNAWANVEAVAGDREIATIDALGASLGALPESAQRVRELITRFEICHFKREKHYRNIRESIAKLRPAVEVDKIGGDHPRNGAHATGRGRTGWEYVAALESWLARSSPRPGRDRPIPIGLMPVVERRVRAWLADRSDTKERLVRMLLARLRWDWASIERNRSTFALEGIEYQIATTDICHYTFPRNVERVVQAIGKLEPVERFEGCGTYCKRIEFSCASKYSELCEWLTEGTGRGVPDLGPREPIRVWLVACMAKTLKANVKLREPLPDLSPWT